MALKKVFNGIPSDLQSAEGILEMDWKVLTPCQRECTTRLGMTIQLEQEAYLTQHPEIRAALEVFIAKMVRCAKRRVLLQAAAEHFTRPHSELEKEVRKRLGLPMDGPYIKQSLKSQNTLAAVVLAIGLRNPFAYFDNGVAAGALNMAGVLLLIADKEVFQYEDQNLIKDLKDIINKRYPPDQWKAPPSIIETPNTLSSSFISIITSETTQPTPEPVKTPTPTTSQLMFNLVSRTVDKAVFAGVNDYAILYDCAFVEVTKAVEEAMEIPVKEIKEDIAELFFESYKMFDITITEKERIAAENAWEKRMRKKLKRTLRRQKNFKGYETPPTPKSEISSHESYKKPPQRPCSCNLPFYYNRYPKDRFGIYLPKEQEYSKETVTAPPALVEDEPEAEEPGASSARSTASTYSRKSTLSKKRIITKSSS